MPDERLKDVDRSEAAPLHAVHISTGLGLGGAEGVLYRLLAHQDRVQWPSSVISLTPGGVFAAQIEALGIEVRSLDMRPGRMSLPAFFRLVRMLSEMRPDVVQSWMYHANLMGGLAARMAGVRRIFWGLRHTSLDPHRDKRSTIFVARLGGWLSGWLPEKVICCSRETYRSHREAGYRAEKLVMIPNGYDLSRFKPDAAAPGDLRRELNLQAGTKLIGMAARFHPQKDHRGFIRAAQITAAQVEQIHFILCGAGMTADNAELLSWIKDAHMEERFHLLGMRADMPRIYAGLDIHALVSHGEGFPNVVAESMACGTLTAATDVGDAAEIIGDSGWVVPPDDPAAMAGAWGQALALDPAARETLARTARERVRTSYDIRGMVKRYEEIYRGEPDQEAGS